MKASTRDEWFAKEIEDELMKYTTKYDEKVEANQVTKTSEVQTNSGEVVDITECTRSLRNELVSEELQDTSETSSSFDDCSSGGEDDTFVDSESLADFHGDVASAAQFDKFVEWFGWRRRKKLKAHWRSFIRPLMWRCKWVELQMKKLQSQARRCDRKLEAYNDRKFTQLDNSTMTDATRSLPSSRKNVIVDVSKRKKRRRTETTVDVATYMSHHNLFSYNYENRKFFTSGAFPSNELNYPVNLKITTDQEEILDDNELLSVELWDGDDSIAQILLKIDFLESAVGQLKSRLYSILESVPFTDNLDLPRPHSENGAYIASQSKDILVPPTVSTSYLDFHDTIGSIAPTFFEVYETLEEGILLEEEINWFELLKIQQMPDDGLGNTTPPVIAEPYDTADDGSPEKARSIAKINGYKSKRRGDRRKDATGGGRSR